MGQISNIAKGWNAYLKKETTPLAKSRAEICQGCDFAVIGSFEKFMKDESIKIVQGLKCGKCKCPLSAKLRSQDETCPLNKW